MQRASESKSNTKAEDAKYFVQFTEFVPRFNPFGTLGVGPIPLVPDRDLTLEWPLKGSLSQN